MNRIEKNYFTLIEFVLKWKIKFSLRIALQTIICNYLLLIGSVCTSVGVSNNTEFVMVCLTCMMALKCELGTGTICDRDTAIETVLNMFFERHLRHCFNCVEHTMVN